MSYASVAAANAPPPEAQPHADPALLTTEPPSANNITDDAVKVNLVSPDFRSHPATTTSVEAPGPDSFPRPPTTSSGRPPRSKKYLNEAEQESFYLWSRTKHYLFQPGVAGGLLGLLNVGLLSGAGYLYYTRPHLRRDTKTITSTVAAALSLLGAESYAAEKYRETPAGQAELRKAKQEGDAIYRAAREHILRPGVLGGLVGVVNAGIIGTVGYFAYANWDRPRWDRRTVSAISVALLSLWSGEGYLAERYRTTRH